MISTINKLSFNLNEKTPIILQSEHSECGVICLAMISAYHGKHLDVMETRKLLPISRIGSGLGMLARAARTLELTCRVVRLDLGDLDKLKLPCILHWNLNHFVVLTQVKKKYITIHDPATGARKVSVAETSTSFTGFAMEAWPAPNFCERKRKTIRIVPFLKKIIGAKRALFSIFLTALTIELLVLVNPIFIQIAMDDAIPTSDKELLGLLAVGFGALMLIQESIKLIKQWLLLNLSTNLNVQLRANIFNHLVQLPIEYFFRRSLGEITTRFSTVDQIQRTLTATIIDALIDGVLALCTLALLILYSPKLATISVTAISIYLMIRLMWFAPLVKASDQQQTHTARLESHFLETIRGIRAIKLFQKQEDRTSSWLSLLVNKTNHELRIQKLHIFYHAAIGFIFGIENILIVTVGATLVVDNELSAGGFVAFIAYKTQFGTRITALINKAFDLRLLQVPIEKLSDILLSKKEVLDISNPDSCCNRVAHRTKISISNLTYSHEGIEKKLFENFNLTINSGDFLAITGPSGSGKTTLLNIILGILTPQEGTILINDKSLETISSHDFRRVIGTVMQDDHLFAGTISENISFFDRESQVNHIEDCAKLAAVHEEILTMPMGYNTYVGDMGSTLSGGQKQRILLARALYKKPSILFLDEATSHLDIDKEREVNEAISRLNITRVIVAHRPETISSADRVITLNRE